MRRNRWYAPDEFLTEALAIRRRLLGPRHPLTLETLASLGRAEGASAPATGAPKLQEALAAQRTIFGNRHPTTARTLLMLGQVLRKKEGEVFLNEAGAIYRETMGLQSAEVLEVNCALGACQVEQRRFEDAEKILRQTLADSAGFLSPAHPVRLDAILWLSRALILGKDRAAEAEPLLRQGIALAQRAENSRCAQLVLALKGLLVERKDLAGAEQVLREALAIARPLAADDPLRLAAHLASLVEVLLPLERFVEAEAAARECLALRMLHDKKGWLTQNAHRLLGDALAGQGKIAEAETVLLAGFHGLRDVVERFPDPAKGSQAEMVVALVRLYRGAGRAAEAMAWMKKGIDLSRAWEAEGEPRRAEAFLKKLNAASDAPP